MRILISMHYSPPHIGGMESIVKKQITSLSKLGHKVKLVTCRHDAKLPLKQSLSTHEVKRFRSLNFIENKFGVTYPIISPLTIVSLIRDARKVDIVHVHDVFYILSHLSSVASVITRKPLYVTQHVAMVDHPSKLVMVVQKIIYSTIGKYIFRKARAIIVYNVNVRDFLLELGIDKQKIKFIKNGIDVDYFSPTLAKVKTSLKKKYNLSPDKPVALFVGRLVPKKGFDIMAKSNSNDYTTLIVGNGTVPEALRNRKNVVFFGPANEKQLLDLYRLSDVFVFPAIGEIFTLVMQEAMSCGLPIVTTNNKGYEEYEISEKLVKFVERKPNQIKQKITEIINDHSLNEKMSKYSRQYACDHFDWNKNYRSELAVYRESA